MPAPNDDPMGDALDMWVRDTKDYHMLPDTTIRELCRRAQAGDIAARNEVVTANIGLITHIAERYQGHGLDLTELVNVGAMGVMRAIAKYDPDTYRFSTYAVWWIRSFIQGACIDDGDLVRIPRGTAEKRQKARKSGIVPAKHAASIAAADMMDGLLSLDIGVANRDGDTTPIGEMLLSEATLPEDAAIAGENYDELYRLLRLILTPHELLVIALRYGLGAVTDEHTLLETGRKLGITRQRVQQIEARAILKLRQRCMLDDDGALALKSAMARHLRAA